ncbi:MAG TPA: ABC transporter permease subunit [Syntrophomonadaceae bacterium]|nr:ABC transporter permease subunit [Syntrophomonadaceae bacterium]
MNKSRVAPYLLLLPVYLLSLLFIIGIGNGILQSFGVIPSLGLNTPTLDYYVEIFKRKELLSAIGLSFYVALASSLLATVIGVLLCAALVMGGLAKGKAGQVLKIPIMIPHTVVALFIISLFSQSGLLARLFYAMGIIGSQESFPSILYTSNGIGIILAYLWKEIPFVVFFVISIMSNISSTLGEAAENLGASKWRAFRSVTLPLCMPAIKNAFLIIFVYSLGAYELPYLLGATVPKMLPIQAFIEYTHPDLLHRPYAMAMNGIVFFISFLVALLYYRFLQHDKNHKIGRTNL